MMNFNCILCRDFLYQLTRIIRMDLKIMSQSNHHDTAATDQSPSQEKTVPLFHQNLHRLEAVVEQMEKEQPSLEQTLSLFEEGMSLVKECQHALEQAEQKVVVYTGDGADPEPFLPRHDDE